MAGKKALGSWDVNDKRTKAGKEKQLQTNGVKMFDSTVSIASGLFKTGKNKNTKTKSKSSYAASTNDFEYEVLSEEEIQKRKEKDKKSLPYMIILGVVSIVLVIFFWLFIISLF